MAEHEKDDLELLLGERGNGASCSRDVSDPGTPLSTEAGSLESGNSKPSVDVPKEPGWKKLLAFVGPGFLVAIAYIDPGNFESDLQAGALYKYELLWVLLWASVGGLFIQSLSANLGVVTGKHLAEHCRAEYPRVVNWALWGMAELAIVASDIPEVIGTAMALWMLFGLPMWVGVLVTGASTLILLALQTYGVRKLEMFISILILIVAVCFFIELFYAKANVGEVITGLVVPKLRNNEATAIAISLVGAVVMPHNLYLHSALVLSRKVPRTMAGIRDGCWYNFVECSFALVLAFAINVSIITVSGAVCSRDNLSPEYAASCKSLDLNEAPFLLRNTLGSWSSQLFAIALLASGQSSTITGTYAGQYVMQGFLDLRIKPWFRNLLTRSAAIIPSLIVALIGGTRSAGSLIILSSMILSFELPFALLPLLKFTSSPVKMGPFINNKGVTAIIWLIGLGVCAANMYLIISVTITWINTFSVTKKILVGTAVGLFLIIYVSGISYLALRPDKQNTFMAPTDQEEEAEAAENQKLIHEEPQLEAFFSPREDILQMQLPGEIHSGHAI